MFVCVDVSKKLPKYRTVCDGTRNQVVLRLKMRLKEAKF